MKTARAYHDSNWPQKLTNISSLKLRHITVMKGKKNVKLAGKKDYNVKISCKRQDREVIKIPCMSVVHASK